MKAKRLRDFGIPKGTCFDIGVEVIKQTGQLRQDDRDTEKHLRALVKDPDAFLDHEIYGKLARAVKDEWAAGPGYIPRETPAPYRIWGEGLEEGALRQMANAANIPVAVSGALMPDAHQGYGLPIGGVLATEGAIIPYAVGVDIACRMKMTVLDMPVNKLERKERKLIKAIEDETRFGMGAHFKDRRDHDVMDRDWSVTEITRDMKDKAWSQLGTSGSGNHFVEFGTLKLEKADLGLPAGTYLALLSHSGSRGAGAQVANTYSKLAQSQHQNLPRELRHLSWLGMDSEEGQEYWEAMNLMGHYAAANHACIHKHVVEHLGAEVLLDVENHHNFAWKEEHNGKEVYVHRKGATPAGEGVLGIIPGSMAAPGFIVRGKGNAESLNSASHGAGRRMSRTAANRKFSWDKVNKYLKERQVKLLSAGLDESPMAYKDIHAVMAQQDDLVETIAQFNPRLVKMAQAGERPED